MNFASSSEDQLTALETALARGEHRVTFADKTVEYRSVEDLKAAIREVKRGLKIANSPRQIRVTSNKGF